MRRYLQGTLDFHCGVYCVINALSAMYGIDLSLGRHILAESVLHISRHPDLHEAFLFNRSDHYWVVAYMLARWGSAGRFPLNATQPIGGQWLAPPQQDPVLSSDRLAEAVLKHAAPYLPEPEPDPKEEEKNQALAWNTIGQWLRQAEEGKKITRAVILRFHRFLPGIQGPVVSHWTTAFRCMDQMLALFDASSEPKAVYSINHSDILPTGGGFCSIRIVPESILLLSRS